MNTTAHTIYQFQPDNGIFSGTAVADADPMEWQLAQQAARDAILVPANASYDDAKAQYDATCQHLAELRQQADADFAAATSTVEQARVAALDAFNAVPPSVFLIPAYATALAPPTTTDHQVAVFDGSAWQVQPDWRTALLFSKADGSPVTIEDINITPAQAKATDQPRPSMLHSWNEDGGDWELDAGLSEQQLERDKAALIGQINADVDRIYQSEVGQRQQEYDRAEQDAAAFLANPQQTPVPLSISSWASVNAQSDSWAAQDILTQATKWRDTQAQIRATRLHSKQDVANALSDAELRQVQQGWNAFTTALSDSRSVASM